MFTEVVSAVEGMTELHKMERGERGEGERGFYGRALALPTRARRPARFTMRGVGTKGFVELRKSRLPGFVNSPLK